MSLLDALKKDPSWIINRRNSIGGSDCNTIMSGDAERILRLWQEKRGEVGPQDLSNNLAVVMGSFTEPLNAAWFELQTGLAVNIENLSCAHPTADHLTCTLDGRVGAKVWEAKHVNSMRKDEDVLDSYQPQLHHNMAVSGLSGAYLSVIKGSSDWFMAETDYDAAYGQAVRDACDAFWAAVQSGEPPVIMPAPKPPRPVGWRHVDMSVSNTWAMNAPLWLQLKPKAEQFKLIVDELKAAIPEDAKTAEGFGLRASIAKNGAIKFSPMETEQ